MEGSRRATTRALLGEQSEPGRLQECVRPSHVLEQVAWVRAAWEHVHERRDVGLDGRVDRRHERIEIGFRIGKELLAGRTENQMSDHTAAVHRNTGFDSVGTLLDAVKDLVDTLDNLYSACEAERISVRVEERLVRLLIGEQTRHLALGSHRLRDRRTCGTRVRQLLVELR